MFDRIMAYLIASDGILFTLTWPLLLLGLVVCALGINDAVMNERTTRGIVILIIGVFVIIIVAASSQLPLWVIFGE